MTQSGLGRRGNKLCPKPVERLRCLILKRGADMRRRTFIAALGGAAAAWPLAARSNPGSLSLNRGTAHEGARLFGRRLLVVNAGTAGEIDAAFATIAAQRANAVMIAGDAFYATRSRQLAVLAARHGLPMMSVTRDHSVAGGLISYGNSVVDAYRRAGVLTGRILKGAKPAEMPIDRATRFELVINLGTAKALGLTVPPALLARADEVIE